MTEKSDYSFAWSEEWMESQRNYWNAWARLYQQGLGSTSSKAVPPWEEAIESWWKAVSPRAPEPTRDFLKNLIEQGKTYLRASEEFTRWVKGAAEAAKAGASWQALLQSKISELKAAFSQGSTSDMAGALRGMLPFFELPLDTWTRIWSSASVLPGDFLQDLKPAGVTGMADRLHDQIGRFLSVPGVGYTREWQEQAQILVRLALDYERALHEYYNAHNRLGVDALERLLKKIMERSEKGEDIKSLREIYDLWVDCGEEAYNEFVFTEEYSEIYGRLVNALMALKHHSQHLMDEVAAALNLPTRKGLMTLQCRQQELRRQLSAMRVALDQLGAENLRRKLKSLEDLVAGADLRGIQAEIKSVSEVRREVAELRAELQILKASHTNGGAEEAVAAGSPPAARPAARRPGTRRPKPARSE